MNFFDWLKDLFGNEKESTKITTKTFEKVKGETNALEIALTDNNDKGLKDKPVKITINGVTYNKTTDDNGIATLNINLLAGAYTALCNFDGDDDYNPSTGYAEVFVNPEIQSQDMIMSERDGSKFTTIVTDANGVPIDGLPVTYEVNGVEYERTSQENGETSLNINLNKGTYTIVTSSVTKHVSNVINITEKPKKATRMEGTDVNKAKSDSTPYQCAVYDDNGRVAGTVKITINGVTYTRTPDNEGLYKLNINLNPGTYKVTAEYVGDNDHLVSSVVNTVVVVADPEKTIYNPIIWLRQPNGYTCGPTSLAMCSQVLGKSVSISAFTSVCKTDSNGTTPANLIAGAKSKGFTMKTITRNITGVKKAIDSGKPVVAHIQTQGVSCCGWKNNYGHYIVIYNYSGNYYKVADPTKGLCTCKDTMIDNATQGRDIKYYSVELS